MRRKTKGSDKPETIPTPLPPMGVSDSETIVQIPRIMAKVIEKVFEEKRADIDLYWKGHDLHNLRLSELEELKRTFIECVNNNDNIFALLKRIEQEGIPNYLDVGSENVLRALMKVVESAPDLIEIVIARLQNYWNRGGFKRLILDMPSNNRGGILLLLDKYPGLVIDLE